MSNKNDNNQRRTSNLPNYYLMAFGKMSEENTNDIQCENECFIRYMRLKGRSGLKSAYDGMYDEHLENCSCSERKKNQFDQLVSSMGRLGLRTAFNGGENLTQTCALQK